MTVAKGLRAASLESPLLLQYRRPLPARSLHCIHRLVGRTQRGGGGLRDLAFVRSRPNAEAQVDPLRKERRPKSLLESLRETRSFRGTGLW